jgi:hypothetical protein
MLLPDLLNLACGLWMAILMFTSVLMCNLMYVHLLLLFVVLVCGLPEVVF